MNIKHLFHDDNKLAELFLLIDCDSVVNAIVEKYTSAKSPSDASKVNDTLTKVLQACEPDEEVILLTFMNRNAFFTQTHKAAFDKAISTLEAIFPAFDEPQRHLRLIRQLLDQHDTVESRYLYSVSQI